MMRVIPPISVGLVVFITFIVLSWLVAGAGLVPDDTVTLWASAITAGDGEMSAGRIVAAYPTLPFIAATLLEFATPAGTPTPVLLSGCLLALLSMIWLASFRRSGLPLVAAIAAVLLIALHPAMLRAAIAGPAEMILAAFLCLLGVSLHDLRARSGAPEVMAAALSLLGLAFSHPMGAAFACAAIPLLVFAVRPELVVSSAYNVVIALIFPTAFAVFAFSYMSWVFPGSGWSFLAAPAEGVAGWESSLSQIFGRGLSGSFAFDAAFVVLVSLLLGAPLVPAALAWVCRPRPLVAPTLVITATTIAAAWITVATGLFGDPAALAVAAPVLAAIIVARVPIVRERLGLALMLLALGSVGGILGIAIADPHGTANVRAALEGRGADRERLAAIKLGDATIGRDGVLVDIFNSPAVVLGRRRARGLLSPSNEAFALGVRFSRIDAPFIAVPDPQIGTGAQDRLNKTFPLLYRRGAPGYRLVYENASWRLFARN